MSKKIDYSAALNVELGYNDANCETVREYLKQLLLNVLVLEESFSGKRPFGNSGWIYEITEPLHKAGFEWDDQEVFFMHLVDAL